MSTPLAGGESGDPRLAAARVEARRLIAQKPWRDRLDWAAGRVIYDPGREGSLIDLMVVICFLIGLSALVWSSMDFGVGAVAIAILFLIAGALLIGRRVSRNRLGRSDCVLRSIPARIGGVFEAEIRVRLSATQALVSLTNVDFKNRQVVEVWRAEQRIGRDEIRVAGDGTWTMPVHVPIPPEVRTRPLGPLWRLKVHVQAEGADFKPHFEVPVFDLADLPCKEEERKPIVAGLATSKGSNLDIAMGLLVGSIIGFGVGFGFADRVAYKSLKVLFLVPFLGPIVVFMMLGTWRNAAAIAIRDRELPDRGRQMRQKLVFLTLVPWAAAAIVLWIAWKFLPYAGFVWGLGMLLCAHPSPFGRFERDPLFQSGAALLIFTAVVLSFR